MDWSKKLSLVVAVILIIVVFWGTGEEENSSLWGRIGETVTFSFFWLLISLGLIWRGDELGEGMVGAKFGLVSKASPGCLVVFMGWVFLLLPVLVPLFLWLFEN